MPGNLEVSDVREATHVKVGNEIKKISSKWGVRQDGHLSPPSEGGFGVVTDDGQRVSMMEAQVYYKKK